MKLPFALRPGVPERWWRGLLLLLAVGLAIPAAAAPVADTPFLQVITVRYPMAPELQGANFRRLVVDDDDIAYVLSDRGLARVFNDRLAPDRTWRPLAGKLPRDITLHFGGLYYLFDDYWLSNTRGGRPFGRLPPGAYSQFAIAPNGAMLFAGATNLALLQGNELKALSVTTSSPILRLCASTNGFFVLSGTGIHRVTPQSVELFHRAKDLTALAVRGEEVLVGTRGGYYGLNALSGQPTFPLQDKAPWTEVTCLAPTASGLWVGTTRGVFLQNGPGRFRYFASKRWLEDDHVVDLQPAPNGDCYVLTRMGLNKLEARHTTLAEKAAFFDQKIRRRHIRYGFCSELRLAVPGDPTSAEMIDTDNDGTWSSLYLASQAFRYAVTGEEAARANAWETFDALERTQSIAQRDGYPARTFERTGFKVSDPDRWQASPEPGWEWKSHTSSDELTSQTFAYAVLWEAAARSGPEKQRLAAAYDRMIGHLVRNNLYLVDVDGQPTLWGRWNPEYVNHYPPTIVDRRLNSAEIIAFLQFAYRVTGKEVYHDQADDLFLKHGYLKNITNSMTQIRLTPGYVFRGQDMGSEWNHSDDQLAFLNYWTLFRFAFTDQLRRSYSAAIRDHWELERNEQNPIWNFIYGMTGAANCDVEAALWTLQRFPVDLVSWTIQNSHRKDLIRLPANFRGREIEQLLPPDERPSGRWNGSPFVQDGGNGGMTEFAGEEFLLPYWMGRYLKLIR